MLSREAEQAIAKVPRGTVAETDMNQAVVFYHPLLCAMDAMLRAAKIHRERNGASLKEDYVLGPIWLKAIRGVRKLADGDFGPVDNGVLEDIFWMAIVISGYTEADF